MNPLKKELSLSEYVKGDLTAHVSSLYVRLYVRLQNLEEGFQGQWTKVTFLQESNSTQEAP